ncbi:trissin receptor [Haematobia irritans]|uniref:trissin receptor n=1 Tax=Haematobia irritans TaxID=7368 RepID=UPI003F5059D8
MKDLHTNDKYAQGHKGTHMETTIEANDNPFNIKANTTTMSTPIALKQRLQCECYQITNKNGNKSQYRKSVRRIKNSMESKVPKSNCDGEMQVVQSPEDRLTAYMELSRKCKTSTPLPSDTLTSGTRWPSSTINFPCSEDVALYRKESAIRRSISPCCTSSTSPISCSFSSSTACSANSQITCRHCPSTLAADGPTKFKNNMTLGSTNHCSFFATALRCTLLQRLLVPVVWHATASSLLAVLVTLFYSLAHVQGVMATLASVTPSAIGQQQVYSSTTSQTMLITLSKSPTLIASALTLATQFDKDNFNNISTTISNNNNNHDNNQDSLTRTIHRSGNKRLNRKGGRSGSEALGDDDGSNIFTSNPSIVNDYGNVDINMVTIRPNINGSSSVNTTTEMTILNDVSASLTNSSSSVTSVYGHMVTFTTTTTTQSSMSLYTDIDVLLPFYQNETTTNQNNSHNGSGVTNDEGFDDLEDIKDPKDYIFDRTDVRIIFITLYTIVFCCCFFGNLLVILVVTLSRRLRSITNFFLANLALADFCVGVFCVMQTLSLYLIDSWVFGEFLCRMYQFVQSLSYTASIFILVVICMERYFAIVHPITCKQILTAARLRMVILTVWITSAVYSTPKFVFSKTVINVYDEGGQEEVICVLDRKMFNSKLLDMINFGLLYVIPLLVMTVLYSKIAIALWRSSRGLSHHLAQQQDNSMGLHNSMYSHHHHHHHPQQQHNHLIHNNHHLSNNHPSSTSQHNAGMGTPISAGSVASSTLSRKGSSKYDKRRVDISESQVSLDSDRPVVSACRKTSFFQHHNHLTHHQQQQQQQQTHHGQTTALTSGNPHRSHLHHNHGSHHGMHGSQRVSHFSHSSNNVLRARRGVVRMLIIFVLTFALCNLPCHARKMWQYWSHSYRGDSNFNALLTPLTFLVTYFNSGINPLLYAFLSRNFRKGMRELLMCSWRKSKTKSSTNSSMHHKRMALQTHSLPTDTTHIGNEQL